MKRITRILACVIIAIFTVSVEARFVSISLIMDGKAGILSCAHADDDKKGSDDDKKGDDKKGSDDDKKGDDKKGSDDDKKGGDDDKKSDDKKSEDGDKDHGHDKDKKHGHYGKKKSGGGTPADGSGNADDYYAPGAPKVKQF